MDYYKILGLPDQAGDTEIKSAYRKLARKYHPDRNPGDKFAEDRFKQITEAYRVLSDVQRRDEYDRGREPAQTTNIIQTPPPSSERAGPAEDVLNIFEHFSSARPSAQNTYQPVHGGDLHHTLTLSFEDAVLGLTTAIEVNRLEACSRCKGSGVEPQAYPILCPTCLGKGRVRQAHGFLGFMQVCHDCDGTGRIHRKACTSCRGTSRVPQHRKIAVQIPPDIHDGDSVKMAGEGESGAYGGAPGDLYIHLQVRPHEFFGRNERDLSYELPVSITQIILGDVVRVPTLEGNVRIRIPPGTQPDQVFRLTNRGVPDSTNGNRGDLLIKVKLQIPTEVSPRQRELLEEFAHLSGEKPKGQLIRFWQTQSLNLATWMKSFFHKS